MKSIKSFLLQIFMMAFLFPAMVLSVTQLDWMEADGVEVLFLPQEECFHILVRREEGQQEMELEDYVTQVVLGEMPAEFETEALKAQAIAARTFAWRAKTTGGKHGDGTVCTGAGCCQGFLTKETFLNDFGTPEEYQKIADAVDATAGMVVTYRGQLIEAAYFSSSGGTTEDAIAVWGGEYPYLISKDSPEETNQGAQSKAFSAAFLEGALNTRLEGEPDTWFHDWDCTSGGGVERVGIGNRFYSGTQVRKLLNLRSTLFSVTIENDVVFFHTLGYGHRVGMSQFGANTMAKEGKTCKEILEYYYTGTELTQISDLETNAQEDIDEIFSISEK